MNTMGFTEKIKDKNKQIQQLRFQIGKRWNKSKRDGACWMLALRFGQTQQICSVISRQRFSTGSPEPQGRTDGRACPGSLSLPSHTPRATISMLRKLRLRAVISQDPSPFREGLELSPNFQEANMLNVPK